MLRMHCASCEGNFWALQSFSIQPRIGLSSARPQTSRAPVLHTSVTVKGSFSWLCFEGKAWYIQTRQTPICISCGRVHVELLLLSRLFSSQPPTLLPSYLPRTYARLSITLFVYIVNVFTSCSARPPPLSITPSISLLSSKFPGHT